MYTMCLHCLQYFHPVSTDSNPRWWVIGPRSCYGHPPTLTYDFVSVSRFKYGLHGQREGWSLLYRLTGEGSINSPDRIRSAVHRYTPRQHCCGLTLDMAKYCSLLRLSLYRRKGQTVVRMGTKDHLGKGKKIDK